jgi:type IV secretory pathway TraG/TraD family ATPase VirD4
LTLGHQSLSGNLKEYGTGALNEIIDNTNISVLLTQRANESVEEAANISGTKKVVSESYQTEEKQQFLMTKKSPTGQGNIFLKNEYNIDPNAIRSLQTGEAYCVVSEPPMQHLVMLNYVPPLPPETFPKIAVKTPEVFNRIPLPSFTDQGTSFKKAKVRKEKQPSE